MSPTWETSTEWDASQSETGTHHEQPSGTDWSAADTVERGYPSSDRNGSSLVAYWPCDEDSGSTFGDVSGNNNDLSLTNVAVNDDRGMLGTSTGYYDGSAYSEATSIDGCNDTEYTVAFWANFSQHDDYARFIQIGGDVSSSPDDGWDIEFDTDTDVLQLTHWSSGSPSSVGQSSSLEGGQVYFIAAHANGDSGALHVYGSGGELTNSPWTGTGTRGTTTSDVLHVGVGGSSNYIQNGVIDEIRLYNRELTDAQIDDLYNTVLTI